MSIKIWLGSLAKYNSGELSGEWIELPLTEEELVAVTNKYTADGQGDYFLADWECPIEGIVSEYSNVSELNGVATQLSELADYDLERVKYLVEQECLKFSEAMGSYEDVVIYGGQSLRDVAYTLVEDGLFGEIPETIANYIDYEAIARDLQLDGYTEWNGNVYEYRN